jgi:arylsulfatase A-like enzyme
MKGAATLLIGCAVVASACGTRHTPPRNLLVITLDTMRADRLPPYGAADLRTPTLSRLASEGVIFDQAFASVPLTLPSHASLFTGLQPPRLGVRDNAGAPVPHSVLTLAEMLEARGMKTGAVLASGVLAPGRGLEQGFADYGLAKSADCSPAHARRSAEEVISDGIGWLDGNSASPFFLWLHLYDTHQPHALPAQYARAHFDSYAAAIAYEDAQIARVIAYLESHDLLANTLIVIAGDHGESLGEHGEDTHGILLYQTVLQVPLIMRGPGIRSGRVDTAVRLIDVMPTITDLFAVPRPEWLDGSTLVPLLKGQAREAHREVYAESLYPLRFGWAALRSLRADQYKLIDGPRPELYDLSRDPFEQENIIESRAAVASAMRERLRIIDSGDSDQAIAGATPEVAARLASLGYVSGSVRAADSTEARNPRDHIHEFNEITLKQASINHAFGCGPSPSHATAATPAVSAGAEAASRSAQLAPMAPR